MNAFVAVDGEVAVAEAARLVVLRVMAMLEDLLRIDRLAPI